MASTLAGAAGLVGQDNGRGPSPGRQSGGVPLGSGRRARAQQFRAARLAATMISASHPPGVLGGVSPARLLKTDRKALWLEVGHRRADATVGCLAVRRDHLRIGTTAVLRKPRPLWTFWGMFGCAISCPLLMYGHNEGFRMAKKGSRVREDMAIEARNLWRNMIATSG